MRILFLSQVLPYPLDAGPKIRAYFTLKHLARKHEIVLLSFVRQSDTPEALAHLGELCTAVETVPMTRSFVQEAWSGVRSLATGEPFLIARDRRARMLAAVEKAIAAYGPFDAVHADQLWMAPYATFARRASKNGSSMRLILDQHNAVFQIPRRMALDEPNLFKRKFLGYESEKMARYEIEACGQFDHVVFVTPQDRAALRLRGLPEAPETRESIIPISVEAPEAPERNGAGRSRRVTFLGGLHWPPNADGVQWFIREIWPTVRERVGDAVFTVIGKLPEGLEFPGADSSVELLGYVDDPEALLADSSVFVVPLRSGGGMRVKILDAWSRAIPVVSTSIGAEGLELRNGENILLADDKDTFANEVVRLLSDPEVAGQAGEQGRMTVLSHYDWRREYAAWDRVYR
ncbi:MAG: glycosyltransferase [Bryobacterales bacterium]|nr:glycosyltransferase [Acidobacteriota bacterium]MCB9384642.1 glycosyltransferase [Bryobacterales bacterium]